MGQVRLVLAFLGSWREQEQAFVLEMERGLVIRERG